MMANQTTIQSVEALRWGSAKVEAALYSDGFGSLQNLGAIRELVITETFNPVKVISDNAGIVRRFINSQMVNVKFMWLEPELSKLDVLRGGFDTYATVAASPTPVTDEEVVLDGIDFTRLAYKNADNTVVTSIVVTTNDATPVTLTKDTDYGVAVSSDGWTGIVRIAGGAIGDGDTVLVDYSYTPASQKTLSTGGNNIILPIVMRFTNTDEDSTDLRIDLYQGTWNVGMIWTFLSDQAEDVMQFPVEIEGDLDESRTAGDQLLKIYDGQAVA
jgi:hypothetical protein